MSFSPTSYIWTEKYRPKKVSELIGNFREKILSYLKEPMSIPNFLFYSKSPGTGKTTLMYAIINELECDYIIINSSSDRTMETVREKVKEFAMSKSTKPGLKRCVVLDEIDGMLKASQEALRNTIETYAKNCFFIMSCNNVNRVIDPLRSRCVEIAFAYPSKEEIYNYLVSICANEQMNYTDEGIKTLIDRKYPSIRDMVLQLQDMKVSNKEVILQNIVEDNQQFEQLWQKIKEKNWLYVKEVVMSSNIDPRELNSYFWGKALEEENLKAIQLTCRNERDFSFGSDPKIIMITSLMEMVK